MRRNVEPLAVIASSVAVHRTNPCIKECNFSVCLELLNSCLLNDRFIIFNHLLKTWPHYSLQIQIRDERVHYVQSIAILAHQHLLSKELREVMIICPNSGHQTTKVLLDAANGKLEDYETVQTTHPIDQRKRRKLSKPSSTDDCDAANRMTIHAPLNINIHNARLLLRYLRIGKTKSNIELIPHSLIFTSLPFSTACKVLTALDHYAKLDSLAIHFCIQDNELIEPSYITALEQFQNISSLSLTYNFLNGAERERELSRAVQSLPRLRRLDLTGNVRCNAYDYMSSNLVELVLTNVYPTADTMERIGQTCGGALQVLNLSDNGLNTRQDGLRLLLGYCTTLRTLQLCGNNYASPSDVTQLLSALHPTLHSLRHLDLSHNLLEEQERRSVIERIVTFPGLKTLVLGEYLPDLMITEDVQRVERELLDLLGRSDVVSVDENGLRNSRWLYDRLMQAREREGDGVDILDRQFRND